MVVIAGKDNGVEGRYRGCTRQQRVLVEGVNR